MGARSGSLGPTAAHIKALLGIATAAFNIADSIGISATAMPSVLGGANIIMGQGGSINSATAWNEVSLNNNLYFDGSNFKYRNTAVAAQIVINAAGQLYYQTAASGTAGTNASLASRFSVALDGTTSIGGTLGVTGAATFSGGIIANNITSGGGGSQAFGITAASTSISGTLGVTGVATFSNNITTTGFIVVNGNSVYSGGYRGTTSADLVFGNFSGVNQARFFNATGNLVLQNGGTYADIASSRFTVNSTTQGSLPFPRVLQSQRTTIDVATQSSLVQGLMVYQTDGSSAEGLYVYRGGAWWQMLVVNASGATPGGLTVSGTLGITGTTSLADTLSFSVNNRGVVGQNTNTKILFGGTLDLYGSGGISIAYGTIPTTALRLYNTGNIVLQNGGTYTDDTINALQVSGSIISNHRSLSANPTTSDIASGKWQVVKNTTNGEVRIWVNDGGTMKSALLS